MTLTDTAAELIRTDPALANEIARQLASTVIVGLTRRQADALRFIRSFHSDHGYMPSYDEIAAGIGIASKGRIAEIIVALEQRGYVKRLPGKARSIALVGVVQ